MGYSFAQKRGQNIPKQTFGKSLIDNNSIKSNKQKIEEKINQVGFENTP